MSRQRHPVRKSWRRNGQSEEYWGRLGAEIRSGTYPFESAYNEEETHRVAGQVDEFRRMIEHSEDMNRERDVRENAIKEATLEKTIDGSI